MSCQGTRYRATWNGTVIAESANTTGVEGNQYFPITDVRPEFMRPSDTHTTCHWKAVASYYDVVVDGTTNKDAAWFYAEPSKQAEMVRDRVAFWHGVKVDRVD